MATSETVNFLTRYTQQFQAVKAIILADNEGIYICGSYKQSVADNS